MADEQDARARRDCVIKQIHDLRGIFHGAGKRDLLDDDAVALGVALGLEIPGMFASGMLLVGHKDFVTRLHIDPIGDVAVRFRRIAEQRDLVPLAPHERGQRIPELVPGRVSPDGIVLGIRLVHFFGRGVAIKDGAQNGSRT